MSSSLRKFFQESGSAYVFILLSLIVIWVLSALSLPSSISSLLPAVVALGVILVTRQAVVGLLMGSLAGCLFLFQGDLGAAIKSLVSEHFFSSMQGSWRIGAILFTLILGAFTVVIERGGGFESLIKKFMSTGHKGEDQTRRKLEAATGLMGFICFFDGLANSLLVGRITQPLADQLGVARAKMAYIVDSTSSSVACIAFISTWIATQLSLIQQAIEGRGIDASVYELFLRSITQNFYCVFTIVLVIIVIWRRWDIGAMKSSVAKAGKFKTSMASEDTGSTKPASIKAALIPVIVLAVSIVSLFYLWETSPLLPVSIDKLTAAFSGRAGPYALTLGSLTALLVAYWMFPQTRKEELSGAVRDGAASMLSPLLILIMAWTFGSVIKELGTAQFISDTVGSATSLALFPAAVFITGALISFMTGSSWGTMALLMPIALPAYLDVEIGDPVMLSAVIGAVFSGAVFGDHCSPFSDTTIVSAFACGVSPREHVMTQLPYALLSAGVTLLIGYGGLAIGLKPWLCLFLGSAVLLALSFLSSKKETA